MEVYCIMINKKAFISLIILISISYTQNYNPCEDKRFLEIKNKSLDDMSDREYQYFIEKEKECTEYQKSDLISNKQSVTNSLNNRKTKNSNNNRKRNNSLNYISNIAVDHAKEDKNPNTAATAFFGTAISSYLFSPLIGGTAGTVLALISSG